MTFIKALCAPTAGTRCAPALRSGDADYLLCLLSELSQLGERIVGVLQFLCGGIERVWNFLAQLADRVHDFVNCDIGVR